MIMRIVLIGMVVVLGLSSCQAQNKEKLLTRKWQAISLESEGLDSMMAEQRRFLDTFGRNTTDEENMAMYGFSNIDSARSLLQKEMDDYMAMQDHAIKNTWFEFRKDGMVVMNFSGQEDSTKWHINDEGILVLEESAGSNPGGITMNILSLDDNNLKLQMTEQGMSSTVVFKPADNK